MLTGLEDFLVVFFCVAGSLLFVWILQWKWPSALRREHNDIIGWHVTVLGTTYAVIIGFMLYAVWTTYEAAEVNADYEANCLVNVYRLANGLPKGQKESVQALAREYVNTVIDQEWPAMMRNETKFAGHELLEKLTKTLMETKTETTAEQNNLNLLLTEVMSMTLYRRLRELESGSRLPNILWVVMILGAGITSLSSCLFGTQNLRFHVVQVISVTLLISLALIAVGDIDRPFQGVVHVKATGFERARQTLFEAHP